MDVQDDYALIEDLISQGDEAQTFAVDPKTLEVSRTGSISDLELPLDIIGGNPVEEETRSGGESPAAVTFTRKRVGVEMEFEETVRGKKAKVGSSSSGTETAGPGFESFAPVPPEMPRGKLKCIIGEAGMGDEKFVRQMVKDFKDASTDLFLAKNATPQENRAMLLAKGMRFMHSLYLVDEMEKDPLSREQLLKLEKAFAVAESARERAVAAQNKLKEEKALVMSKLKKEEAKFVACQEEVSQVSEELAQLRDVEAEVVELRKKVEAIPVLVAEAEKAYGEGAVSEFKDSNEMARLLKDQHRKSVTENTNLYKSRGWLNITKMKTDIEADRAAAAEKRMQIETDKAGRSDGEEAQDGEDARKLPRDDA